MGKKKQTNEQFPQKTLLIFSGVFWLAVVVFEYIMAFTLKIWTTWECHVFICLAMAVPFTTNLYLLGKFCEWKNIRILPIMLKIVANLFALMAVVAFIVYLIQKFA